MPNILIKNGDIVLRDSILKKTSLCVDGPRIKSIGGTYNKKYTIIDAKDCYVAPGFIDTHIHGEPDRIFNNEIKYGTTSILIAISCDSQSSIERKVQNIKKFIAKSALGANLLGIRFEWPYINKLKAGAQNPAFIRQPDIKELSEIMRKYKGLLKIMTVAPEMKGTQPVIRSLRKNNIIASIGHSDATYEEALNGIDSGITHATHTFNAMSGLDRREPGAVGAVMLDDRVTAEIILDLIHVHKALFELLLKSKGIDKVIITTDSIAALGKIGDSPCFSGGAYRFEDGRLAGSALTMIRGLKNAVQGCGLNMVEAVRLITLNPARLLGIEDRKGSIDTGKDADIVIFDKEFEVKMTMIRGRIAYRKGNICAG